MSKVILVRGKPGVGKTAISSEISKILKIPVVRKDDYYDALASTINSHDTRNAICKTIIFNVVENYISCGIDAMIDTTWHYMNQVIDCREWVLKKKADFISILCVCSDEKIWAERFNQRKLNPKPNNLITDFNDLKNYLKDLRTEPLAGELILDTVRPLDSLIVEAVNRLLYN